MTGASLSGEFSLYCFALRPEDWMDLVAFKRVHDLTGYSALGIVQDDVGAGVFGPCAPRVVAGERDSRRRVATGSVDRLQQPLWRRCRFWDDEVKGVVIPRLPEKNSLLGCI